MAQVKLYDTTLRDGTQGEEIAFTVEDKLRIARKLDELGIHYIEGGWPGSNPKDLAFFREARKLHLKQSRIAAFGSTRRAKMSPEHDAIFRALVEAETEVITIFGKSGDLHVREALRITLEQNLEIVHDSVRYLKTKVNEVIYDAEHFFDGYRANPEYAMKTLQAAEAGGADCIVLCDTNGGSLPSQVRAIIEVVRQQVRTPLGIHTHNDGECAVANSLVAVEAGAIHVQGTINGFGERCGNANLCSIIPNLKLKLGIDCVTDEQLARLREVSRFVYELANLHPSTHQPYVGDSAFAHKGGVHVSAVARRAETYEHIQPELVGNRQRILISDRSGVSNVVAKAQAFGLDLKGDDPVVREILEQLKELEHQGFQFEGAEASFELLMRKAMGRHKKFFNLVGFRVIDEKRKEDEPALAEATIQVKVGGKVEHTAAVGNGPVHALDNALRKALEKFYPELKEVRLLDYKVRVLTPTRGTAAVVRVLIESGDKHENWGTVGVSENILHASSQALIDSIEYKLLKEERRREEGRDAR
ncbi:MAG: citramalate synthase [Deltaproteobacteria bacterium]|nr:citramalate synthase [Deltaproteobacteria bacterium]